MNRHRTRVHRLRNSCCCWHWRIVGDGDVSGGVPSWAVRGAKCVCWTEKYFSPKRPSHPKEGELCTIESTSTLDGWPIFKLVEYPHRLIGMVFRPAVEPKTQAEDVALFTEHLKATQRSSASAKAPADA